MSIETPDGGHSDYQSPGEKITDPAQIARLLDRIKKSRAFLAITIPGANSIYNSAILDVLPQEKQLLLDELNPEDGHAQVINAAKFHSFTRYKGVEIHFTSRILEVVHETQGAYYRAAFPELVDYRQRREFYRVRIGLSQNVSVTMKENENEQLTGRIFDLSAGGLGAFVDRNAKFRIGQIVPVCTVHLPDNKKISSPIEIRYAGFDELTESQRIGARFASLNKAARNTIEKYIAALERELIRKRPKD